MKYQVTTPPTSLRLATSPRKGRLHKAPHLRRQGEYANHRSFGGLLALPVTCPYRAEGSPGLAGGHDLIFKSQKAVKMLRLQCFCGRINKNV